MSSGRQLPKSLPVTDTKWLAKVTRKRLQVAKARRASHGAKLVKLADKIANLRDIVASPPTDWAIERRREYFDWAKSVVEELRGTSPKLERKFDQIYKRRPVWPSCPHCGKQIAGRRLVKDPG